MPGKIKVKILAGRNLPVMDRSGDTTDAYVEIKFGNTTFKTDVCRKSLNPQWNSEWYRFEVDDAELQDEPLQVRLMDHDTYSANDAIGKVYVNLNPLLLPGLPPTVKNIWTLEATMNSSSGSQGGSVMTGWIPVFDTMHGIRGEVNIIVKVELFSDCNKFRQSSCGVQFFYSPNIPHGYHAQVIHGFVEELVVSDDPEYKWIDKIRTPRASNEARQTLFFKLSGEVQRKIGLKALDLGGNAVIGYVQNFDLEGESGIVARGIGTAVTLVKLQDISSILPLETSNIEELTCFDLQSKNHPDFSESDDSLPLLSHSPNQSPISHSPTNLHATIVSSRFPKYEKTRKNPRQSVRVAEYRAAGLRARQLSLQHNTTSNSSMRKGTGSSLSLADDLISESSLKNMLALEDMRGEPVGNPFSRGLKNFRYLHQNILPRRVAQIKSKITDSFDDESDQDSTYSSTWSLAGSESNRSSSIVDLRQSIRRKKFTHKKSANDGIAALLIRSVHSGFPLDSVREDRETPTPSPVNFLGDLNDFGDDTKRRGIFGKKDNEQSGKSETGDVDDDFVENQLLLGKNKHDVKYTAKELLIPMISSSETDTSTSDDDEPSESSTNYNILDDSYSIVDPSSNDDANYQPKFRSDLTESTKIEKFSDKIESSEKKESCDLEPNYSLESSTDYNILDLTKFRSDLPESMKIIEKVEKFSDKIESSEKKESCDLELNYSLESSTGYNILDLTKFRSDLPESTKILEKVEKFSDKIESSEKKESCDLEPNYSLESSTDYNILDLTKFRSDLPESTKILEKVEKFSDKIESSEKKESCDLEPNYSLESSTDYNILDLTKFRSDLPESTKILEKVEKFSDKIESSEKKESCDLEPNYSLESSTDYNILDLTKFRSDLPESTKILEKVEKFSDKIESSKKKESCDLEPNYSLESSTDYNILDLTKFRSDLPESTKILEKVEKFSDKIESSEKKESCDLEPNYSLESSTDYNILDRTKFRSDLPESTKILEKVEKFSDKIESSEKKESCDLESNYSLESSTDYNILDLTKFRSDLPESTKIIEKVEKFSDKIESSEKKESCDLEPNYSLESSTDYNILDLTKFRSDLPESTKIIEKVEKFSDKIESSEKKESCDLEPNYNLESSTDYNILDLTKFRSDLPESTKILEKVEKFSDKIESSEKKESCDLESSTNYNILDNTTLQRKFCADFSKGTKIENKIAKFSDKFGNIEKKESCTLEENCILESSTDYNILDDTNSIDEKKIEQCSQEIEKLLRLRSNVQKNITIDIEQEESHLTDLASNCNIKSNPDCNIFDESKSNIEQSDIYDNIKKISETSTNIDTKNEEISSNTSEQFSSLESKIDYNIFDKSKSIIDHNEIHKTNLEISANQTINAVKLLEIANKLEDVVEKMKVTKIPAPKQEDQNIDYISPKNENYYQTSQQNMQITNLPKDSSTIPPNSLSNFDELESHLKNRQIDEIKQLKHQSSITLRDCHSTSSTNYNFLDESYSPNENSSVDDGKIDQSLQKTINDSNVPEIQKITKIALSTSKEIEKIQQTTEDITNESETEENIISSSQNDSKLESSTDYNILDVSSLTEINSLDDDEKMTKKVFHRSVDDEEFPEIPSALISSLISMQHHQDQSTNQVQANQEHKMLTSEENSLSPPDKTPESPFNSSPIFPNLDTNLTLYFAGKSTTSGPESSPSTTPTKLKHLKFLPKQKHFDSTEDVGFVTSTPVETEVTLFADFETSQKSPSRESFDSSKFDFQFPISSASSTKSKVPKNASDEKSSAESENLSSEKRIQQVCPLGISFDTIRILNDPKTTSEKIDPTFQSSAKEISRKKESVTTDTKIAITKREKSSKKIERTDTVIYKGPAKDRERFVAVKRDEKSTKSQIKSTGRTSPIPIFVAPPPEEHATRLQVPVIQTTNINVQSTFSPDEMKTQHFGSIGSRKFPIDECAISDKFNRKYRQHCILDLIRTIDAKMMVHHMHHERRDSTKSKRKKRDRINASATPSPDSIHRTRPHNHTKRRSRSRSPDRQHTSHQKNQVSTLSTHSFPGNSSLKNPSTNLQQDSTSCNSSCENLTRNISSPIVVCQKDAVLSNVIFQGNDEEDLDNKVIVVESNVDTVNENFLTNNNAETNLGTKEITNSTVGLLDPKELEHPVYKSHSAGNLEGLPRQFPLITKNTNTPNTIDDLCVPCSQLTIRQQDEQQAAASSPTQNATSALPSSLGSKVTPNSSTSTKTCTAIPNMHRRSSDSDLSITPKGNSLAGSDRSMGGHMRPSTAIVRTMNQDTMEMLEYPFITMQQYPPGFVLNIGGLVSARSVKLLERITNLEEPEGRDAWWTEIRMEVRSHARALACNVVLGYKEEISICDDVCVLNASGTAAVINLLNASQDQDNVLLSRTLMTTSIESEREKTQVKSFATKTDKSDETSLSGQQTGQHSSGKIKRTSESNDHEIPYLPTLSACSLCHLPYSEASVPFRVDVSKCAICRRAKVPDVLFTTIELPENIPMTGRGVFLQATVCKSKRDLRGELNAKEISDCLPFLEYELHSLLLNKLKVKGMNAIFGLKVQVSVGERLVIGMAVGTAVYLTALPTPSVPQIASGNSWHNEEQLAEIQKTLIETVKKNREFYRLKPIADIENGRSITTSDTDESDDDLPDLDLGIGTKDACVLEVDDVEDMDRINLLIDERPPDDFHVVNTQSIPGLEDLEIVRNLQMFTQISRAKIPAGQFASMPSKYFARMLQTVLFKLRRMVPCALCDMQFKVALPEQDEIQLSVVGMALGLGEPTRFSKYKRKLIPNSTSKDPIKKTDDNDMIFSLDEDQADTTGPQDSNSAGNQGNTNSNNISSSSPLPGLSAQKHRPRSPFRTKTHISHRHKHVPLKERYGVDITPLSYLPGGKIERYLGNLNFFFIRESTSIRENGGLSGFTHSFVTEILAIVRAHITALGGNAMVAFFMTQCVLLHSPHKNQGQCLINVGGDVVTVSYYGDDKYQMNQNC